MHIRNDGLLIKSLIAAVACSILLSSCVTPPTPRTFVSGLTQPRGMAFDRDGNLVVAEAGSQLPPSSGERPAGINHSGRVLRITPSGEIDPVLEGLPYTYYDTTGDTGVTDVAFLRDQLYVLVGEGYDDDLSRTVLVVPDQGEFEVVASILDFAIGMSTSQELQIGYVVSNPYAMVPSDDGELFVSDGASGRILRVTLDGSIRVFAELPLLPLTGMAFGPDGRLYVAMFSLRPHEPGSGVIWAFDSDGEKSAVVEGVTMPIDIAFDVNGLMYVLEFSDGRDPDRPYAPRSGRLLRIDRNGEVDVLLNRLDYPTAMTFSQQNDLYIAVGGAFSGANQGEIVKVACRTLNLKIRCAH